VPPYPFDPAKDGQAKACQPTVEYLIWMPKKDRKRRSKPTWFVYIVRCGDGTLYPGITKDVKRRCQQHNAGTASRYTRSRRPVRLVYQEAHPSQGSALKREAAIKAMTRREKLAMIRARTKAG
jgi:predicted GIY-YIG superfamily endonuclease